MPDSLIILPETDDKTLCLAMKGAVTRADHYERLVQPMRDMIEKYGYYNLVLVYRDDFTGYEPDAAEQSFQTISQLGNYARRIAFVNPTQRKILQTTLLRAQLGQEVMNFNSDELADAIAWAKQG